jgi:adenylate kinase
LRPADDFGFAVAVCQGKPMNILLIGPPGSGKGTQGARLSELLDVEHIAAGDLLRAEVKAGTPLGQEVAGLIARGDLVPDDIILRLVLPAVERAAAANGYVLDGFPRTVAQAEEAKRALSGPEAHADAVIYLDLDRAELVRRVLARSAEQGRVDDTPAVIENRLQVFDEATRPLVDYYRDEARLYLVDASGTADEVTAKIMAVLDTVVTS